MAGSGRLTTHVLDTAHGRPAAGLRVDLAVVDGDNIRELISAATNSDGRVDAPLLEGVAFKAGTYVLTFHVGAYFAGRLETGAAPFLDLVPVRFTVSDAGAHYHVPLLVSPYGYSTYRGS